MKDVRQRALPAGVVLVGVVAGVLAGCASGNAPSESETSTPVPVTSSSQTNSAGSLDAAVAPLCRSGVAVAVGRSALDAALGSRYLRIDVRSCTSRPVTLSRPIVEVVTGAGRTAELRLVLTPVANRSERRFPLAVGATASAGVAWRAEPRTGRVRELRVAATSQDKPTVLPLNLLELRPTTVLDYYPWVVRPDDVFGS